MHPNQKQQVNTVISERLMRFRKDSRGLGSRVKAGGPSNGSPAEKVVFKGRQVAGSSWLCEDLGARQQSSKYKGTGAGRCW